MSHAGNRTFRVFLSSTFSDFAAERNALEHRVFPRLRALCEAGGGSFQAIDLRWGISETASRQQRAMTICLDEIRRCQRISPRPNFLAMIGDRYGWRPVPDQIAETELQELLRVAEDPTFLEEWYRLDTNVVPPVRVLAERPRDYGDWIPIERRLLAQLAAAAASAGFDEARSTKYGASATEQEIVLGALDAPDAEQHVFAFLRTLSGLPVHVAGSFTDANVASFVERDPDAAARLVSLRERLRARLPGRVRDYAAAWTPSGPSEAHLDQLCDDVYAALAGVISAQLEALERADPLDVEVSAHERFREERVRVFVGREGALARIAAHLASDSPHPLVVVGASGSGKSALIARAATSAATGGSTLLRFAGTTPSSSRERSLLAGILEELARARGMAPAELPDGRDALLSAFDAGLQQAASTARVALFVDGIDQLDEWDAPWLRGETTGALRAIVSVRAGTAGAAALLSRVPAGHRLSLPELDGTETAELLSRWLAAESRTLTDPQRAGLLDAGARNGTPLFLRLLFEEARRLRSWDPPLLATETVAGAVRALVTRLASPSEHGALLVERMLSLMVCMRTGISEDELLDLLSADAEVFDDLLARAQHAPPQRRIPMVLWSRLYLDLEPYLAERLAGGKRVLSFFHRAIAEAISEDVGPERRLDRHAAIAAYFEAQALNPRKLAEQVYQQAQASRWDALGETLTDARFFAARIHHDGVHEAIDDVRLAAAAAAEAKAPEVEGLSRSLGDALVAEAPVLRRHPALALQQLHNAMLGGAIAASAARALADDGRPWFELAAADVSAVRVLEQASGYVRLDARSPAAVMGTLVAIAREAGVEIWNLVESRRLVSLAPVSRSPAVAIRFTRTGRLVVAHQDGHIATWEPAEWSGRQAGVRWHAAVEAYGHALELLAADVAPQGEFVASLHGPSGVEQLGLVLKVWRGDDGVEDGGGKLHFAARDVAFSPDGRRLAMAGGGIDTSGEKPALSTAVLALLDMTSGATERIDVPAVSPVTKIAWFRPKYRGSTKDRIALGTEDGSVVLVDGATGGIDAIFPGRGLAGDAQHQRRGGEAMPAFVKEVSPEDAHVSSIHALAFSPDGLWLSSGAVAFGRPGELRVWDLENGALATHFAFRDSIDAIVMLSPASLVVAGPGLLAEVDPFANRRARALTSSLEVAAISTDGGLRAWVDGVDILVTEDGGAEIARLDTAHLSEIRTLAWHPSEALLASGGDDAMACIWRAGSGEKLREVVWPGDSVRCVRFVPDGSAIVIAGDGGRCHVVPLAHGAPAELTTGDRAALDACAASVDGWVAAGGIAGIVHVWEREMGRRVATLVGHSGPVRALAFDGALLVSGGEDGTVRSWDPRTWTEARRAAVGEPVRRVFAHPAGGVVVAAGQEASVFAVAGEHVARLPTRTRVVAAALVPDADRAFLLDALGGEYELRLRSLVAGRERG